MSEEGMGTKVQFKSYLPSYNLERNQNEVSRHSLSCYYEDNILSSSLYDQPLLNQANGYSLCDKEMLKRMMLEHEATFRKQVYELHRLYRLQKELMSELKNREHIWQLPQLCARSSHATGNGNIKSTPKYAKTRDAAIFQSPIETEDSSVQRGEFSEPKIAGLRRKKFDLHLPAEVYIDIDDDARTEKGNNSSPRVACPSNITCNADSNNNVMLALIRNKVDGCIDGSGKLGLHPEDFPSSLELTDLNETMEATGYNEEEGLASSQVIGAKSELGEFQGHQLLSNSSKLSKNLLMSNHGNKQMFSNLVNTYQGEHCQDWSSSTDALAGELRSNTKGSHGGLCYKEFSVISQLAQEKPTISYEFVLPGQNKIDKRVEEKPSPDTETCKGFSKPYINTSGLAAHKMTHPLPNISHSDYSSITSLSISSCTKQNSMKNILIAIQAHTNSNEYAVINSRKADATFLSPYNPSDSVGHEEDVKPKQQNFKGYLSSCENGFHQDLKEEDMSSLQTSQSVIISGESSQRRWSDNLRLLNAKAPRDQKSSSEGWLYADVMQSLEPPWLRKRQNQDDSADLEESASQLMSLRSDHDASASNKQQNKKKDSLLVCCLEDSPCSLHVMERSEAPSSPRSKRILGFPVSESNQKGIECYASSMGLRNQINLKSSASCKDALKTPVILPSYEVPSPFTTTNFTRKVPTIDLEGLLSDTKAQKDIMVEEHKQLNCNLTSVKSASSEEVIIQQTDSNHEAIIREAAENLVLMSLLTGNNYCDFSSSDTLQWFADFVLSTAVSNEISIEKSPCNYNGEDGLDIFEYMTLKLKEVKEEDFVSKPKENQNYGDTCAASLLLTKPRRRQAKKRRQRRDFQKDILPGLASLSRHDVTEDLQTLVGLMKDSGKSCQAGSSRRKTNPKEPNCQARGRRRPRSLAINVSEIHIGSSTEEQTQTKQEISTAGILGWGRTTRRCRRQRLIPSDFSVPLV